MKYEDEQILNWLSDCSKIDRSGYDCGWAFERLIMNDDPIGTADVRIAIRGMEGIDGLRKQASIAMGVDGALGTNPFIKSRRRRQFGMGLNCFPKACGAGRRKR
jgi:hypothetical protein